MNVSQRSQYHRPFLRLNVICVRQYTQEGDSVFVGEEDCSLEKVSCGGLSIEGALMAIGGGGEGLI